MDLRKMSVEQLTDPNAYRDYCAKRRSTISAKEPNKRPKKLIIGKQCSTNSERSISHPRVSSATAVGLDAKAGGGLHASNQTPIGEKQRPVESEKTISHPPPHKSSSNNTTVEIVGDTPNITSQTLAGEKQSSTETEKSNVHPPDNRTADTTAVGTADGEPTGLNHDSQDCQILDGDTEAAHSSPECQIVGECASQKTVSSILEIMDDVRSLKTCKQINAKHGEAFVKKLGFTREKEGVADKLNWYKFTAKNCSVENIEELLEMRKREIRLRKGSTIAVQRYRKRNVPFTCIPDSVTARAILTAPHPRSFKKASEVPITPT